MKIIPVGIAMVSTGVCALAQVLPEGVVKEAEKIGSLSAPVLLALVAIGSLVAAVVKDKALQKLHEERLADSKEREKRFEELLEKNAAILEKVNQSIGSCLRLQDRL